ncbi:MAG: hypothetical protein JSS09_05310 [Verrucomicrobia bacterium]|nr:hypothetical protein [Verrucomicrobiota bacterium]
MNFNITGLGLFIATAAIAFKNLQTKAQEVATSHIKAATKIQSTVRGFQAKSNFLKSKKAATKIQSTVRGFQAKSNFLKSKKAASKVQTTFQQHFEPPKPSISELRKRKELIRLNRSPEMLKKSLKLDETWKTLGNKEEAAKRIISCFQTKSRILDLSDLSLDSLPDEILSHLPLLKELHISGNFISCIDLKNSNLEKIYTDDRSIDLLIQKKTKISTQVKNETTFGLEQLVTFSPKNKNKAIRLIQDHINKKIAFSEEEDKTRESRRKKEEKLIEENAKSKEKKILLERQKKLFDAKERSKPEFVREIESLSEASKSEKLNIKDEIETMDSSDTGSESGVTDLLTDSSESDLILNLSNFNLLRFPEGYGKFLTSSEVNLSNNPTFICYPIDKKPQGSSIYTIALNNRNNLKQSPNIKIANILRLSNWKSLGQRSEAIERIIHCFRSESDRLNLSNLNLTSLPENIFFFLQNLKRINISGNDLLKAEIPTNIEVLCSDNTSIKVTQKDNVISIQRTTF